MFVRLVYESFRRQPRRKLLVGVAVALGAAVATAMIAIATDIGDNVSRELRTLGANLVVMPEENAIDVQIGSVNLRPAGAYLNEADLPKIKGIFWRNNITGFAPLLPLSVKANSNEVTLLGTYFSRTLQFGTQQFTTGARVIFPWWKVQGIWPSDDSQDVLVGTRLASRLNMTPGARLPINGVPHRVAGILQTGGDEDDQIVAPLPIAQSLAGTAHHDRLPCRSSPGKRIGPRVE